MAQQDNVDGSFDFQDNIRKKVFWFTRARLKTGHRSHRRVEDLTRVIPGDFYGSSFENARYSTRANFEANFHDPRLLAQLDDRSMPTRMREAYALISHGYNSSAILGKIRNTEIKQAVYQLKLNSRAAKVDTPFMDAWAQISDNEEMFSVDDFIAILRAERNLKYPENFDAATRPAKIEERLGYYTPSLENGAPLRKFTQSFDADGPQFVRIMTELSQKVGIDLVARDGLNEKEVTLKPKRFFGALDVIKRRVSSQKSGINPTGWPKRYTLEYPKDNTNTEKLYAVIKCLSGLSADRMGAIADRVIVANPAATNLPSSRVFAQDRGRLTSAAACLIASDVCYMLPLPVEQARIMSDTFRLEAEQYLSDLRAQDGSERQHYMPIIANMYAIGVHNFAYDLDPSLQTYAEAKGVSLDDVSAKMAGNPSIQGLVYANNVITDPALELHPDMNSVAITDALEQILEGGRTQDVYGPEYRPELQPNGPIYMPEFAGQPSVSPQEGVDQQVYGPVYEPELVGKPNVLPTLEPQPEKQEPMDDVIILPTLEDLLDDTGFAAFAPDERITEEEIDKRYANVIAKQKEDAAKNAVSPEVEPTVASQKNDEGAQFDREAMDALLARIRRVERRQDLAEEAVSSDAEPEQTADDLHVVPEEENVVAGDTDVVVSPETDATQEQTYRDLLDRFNPRPEWTPRPDPVLPAEAGESGLAGGGESRPAQPQRKGVQSTLDNYTWLHDEQQLDNGEDSAVESVVYESPALPAGDASRSLQVVQAELTPVSQAKSEEILAKYQARRQNNRYFRQRARAARHSEDWRNLPRKDKVQANTINNTYVTYNNSTINLYNAAIDDVNLASAAEFEKWKQYRDAKVVVDARTNDVGTSDMAQQIVDEYRGIERKGSESQVLPSARTPQNLEMSKKTDATQEQEKVSTHAGAAFVASMDETVSEEQAEIQVAVAKAKVQKPVLKAVQMEKVELAHWEGQSTKTKRTQASTACRDVLFDLVMEYSAENMQKVAECSQQIKKCKDADQKSILEVERRCYRERASIGAVSTVVMYQGKQGNSQSSSYNKDSFPEEVKAVEQIDQLTGYIMSLVEQFRDLNEEQLKGGITVSKFNKMLEASGAQVSGAGQSTRAQKVATGRAMLKESLRDTVYAILEGVSLANESQNVAELRNSALHQIAAEHIGQSLSAGSAVEKVENASSAAETQQKY